MRQWHVELHPRAPAAAARRDRRGSARQPGLQLNPRLPRAEERRFHEAHAIVTESWAPIGSGRDLLREPVIEDIARERGKTPAQVVLAWHVQLGSWRMPRTSNPSRLPENLDVFDLELSHADLDRLARLRQRRGAGALDSESFGH